MDNKLELADNYKPTPMDTSEVELPEDLKPLIEDLARNTHDVWAAQRMSDGWTYGPQRDDEAKHHPDLVPYEALTDGEKTYDRATAREALKGIAQMGFKIVPA